METTSLLEKVEQLPAPLKKEVEDFVDFLIYKNGELNVGSSYINRQEALNKAAESILFEERPSFNQKKLKREFGVLKGKIKIADDFDEPLDNFKDYM